MSIPGSDDRARRGTELARRARQRRGEFASIDEARAHFQGRHMFAEFSPESLEAFLDGGLVPNDAGGYKLACEPEDEARDIRGCRVPRCLGRARPGPLPHAVAGRGAQPRGAT